MSHPQAAPRTLSASSISGTPVTIATGENLGKVEHLMIDLSAGKVAYAVLSFGGFLGVGGNLFAVPFSAFRCDCESEEFVLDVPKEKLESAPGFDKYLWPNTADRTWGTEIRIHCGFTPYWANL